MLKKTWPTILVSAFLIFATTSVNAQLNFFNGTNCNVVLKVLVENNAFPCSQFSGATCVLPTVTVPPGSTIVLPNGSCALPVFIQGYRAFKYSLGGVNSGIVDKCNGNNPVSLSDCQGIPRQIRIVSPYFAAIY